MRLYIRVEICVCSSTVVKKLFRLNFHPNNDCVVKLGIIFREEMRGDESFKALSEQKLDRLTLCSIKLTMRRRSLRCQSYFTRIYTVFLEIMLNHIFYAYEKICFTQLHASSLRIPHENISSQNSTLTS